MAAAWLAGCASLPLTPTTAPLAVGFWAWAIAAALDGKTQQPEPAAWLLGEVQGVLTPADVVQGRLGPDDAPIAELDRWLAAQGLTHAQVARGEVIVLRLGLRAAEGTSLRRGLYLPVLQAGVEAAAGDIVEFRVRRERPAEIVRVRAAGAREAAGAAAPACEFRDIPAGPPGQEAAVGSSLAPQGLVATLYCRGIDGEGWQLAHGLWRKPVGIDPDKQATLLIFNRPHRNFATPDITLELQVRGHVLQLSPGGCLTLVLPPGDHVLRVSNLSVHPPIGVARTVVLAADERVVLEFVFDAKKYQAGLPLLHFNTAVPDPRLVHFEPRPARPDESCHSGRAPLVL